MDFKREALPMDRPFGISFPGNEIKNLEKTEAAA